MNKGVTPDEPAAENPNSAAIRSVSLLIKLIW